MSEWTEAFLIICVGPLPIWVIVGWILIEMHDDWQRLKKRR